jgi:molecular chaperone DnaJ
MTSRTVQTRIPQGVKDGQRIRLAGKGVPGEGGGPAGDLYVIVHVAGHAVFVRSGNNVTLTIPVTFPEAVLGAQVKVPVPGGSSVTLKIPAGTANGRTFRVKGKGARRKDGTNGDVLATVAVEVPTSVDDAGRQALQAYQDAMPKDDPRADLLKRAGAAGTSA